MCPSSLSALTLGLCTALAAFLGPTVELHASPAQDLPGSLWGDSECRACHRSGPGLSHPVDIPFRGSRTLPDDRGRLGCLSCHDERAARPGHTSGFLGSGQGLLRLSKAQLCSSCHEAPVERGSAVAHAMSLGRAHLEGAWKGSIGAPPAPPAAFGMDEETRQCLSCHDGTTAGRAAVRAPGQPALPPVGMLASRDHPIGVGYSSFPKGGMAPQYRPQSALPAQIRLFDGKIGCGSCHSPYAGQEELMAVDPKRGNLCLKCHIK